MGQHKRHRLLDALEMHAHGVLMACTARAAMGESDGWQGRSQIEAPKEGPKDQGQIEDMQIQD